VVDHAYRLRIVDDDHVVVRVVDLRCVKLVVATEDLAILFRKAAAIALKRIVDGLRNVEELLLALDDSPFGLEPGVAHDRNERVQNLGDASAERSRRQVQYTQTADRSTRRLISSIRPRGQAKRSRQATCARVHELQHRPGARAPRLPSFARADFS